MREADPKTAAGEQVRTGTPSADLDERMPLISPMTIPDADLTL
jgi:hypothetical protein